MSNLKLIISIIQYLKEEASKESVNADTRESLEVAVQCLQTAYDLEPNDPRLNQTEAFSLAALFDIALASPSSTDVITDSEDTKDPMKKAEMMKNLGNNLMKTNMFSEAVRYYTAAIDLDGQNAIYYGNRAAAYSKLGDFKNAVTDCEKAVEIDPNYAKAYGRLGLAYASLNKHEEAVATFRRALELDPENESYKSNLKIALEKGDKPQMDAPPSMPGPLAGLAQVDWRTLFSNPIFRNMASSLMQDPNIISALTSTMAGGMNPNAAQSPRGGDGDAPPPGLDNGNMNVLYEAGQYLAAQLQAANPDLVEQIRQNTSRNNPGPDGSSTE
ncbi:small glutamine-rich tetratricopeptide repeat-containing protein beta-like [Uloborus diversus]|uniref:small glutamine-rich tetratricopeptide repeat-containing protein beta-like n=1 Tax=Uloborus diversus TaxID=327109 RepID=UPI00240A0994|nr:small glutamine-rich tetratricopeptide repeat-containing protein beta-like [Uloborus diversus]XP_054708401.1 small glutamine-rich tetratricopeptide repeat-containing protein beta-like [Uloborus diversus]